MSKPRHPLCVLYYSFFPIVGMLMLVETTHVRVGITSIFLLYTFYKILKPRSERARLEEMMWHLGSAVHLAETREEAEQVLNYAELVFDKLPQSE